MKFLIFLGFFDNWRNATGMIGPKQVWPTRQRVSLNIECLQALRNHAKTMKGHSMNANDASSNMNRSNKERAADAQSPEKNDSAVWRGGEIHPDDIDSDGEYIAEHADRPSDPDKPSAGNKPS